jgi:multiple sugar transport system ATP-binding protein
MPHVRFEHVSKVFGQHVAIRDLNFEIPEGEFVVFVGPSGCGKTTTLRMLAGLETPSRGKIWIGDRDVTVAPPGDRDISMVFQSYALFPHMSVYKNLAFGPEVRRMRKGEIADRVHRVAELLHLEKLLHRRPSELSGGQRQRIALGRTMIRQPKIFLLDEPLSNLDAALRSTMRSEIMDLQRRLGVTTVYVTHDQIEAMTMGHRIAVFKDGSILQIDTPKQLYRNPVNKFVACFVGSPRMNILPGSLTVRANAATLHFADGTLALNPACLDKPLLVEARNVEIGVRPQDLFWVKDTSSPAFAHRLRGSIAQIETTGPETFVTVDVGGTSVSCMFPSFADVELGQAVELAFDPDNLYLFDQASGENILADRSQRREEAGIAAPRAVI